MPRATGRPINEPARARLRDAQRVEFDAVALVMAAELNRQRTRAKMDAVIAKHQVATEEADHTLSKAQAHLVSVSGIHRAALLVDQPVAALRAAVRGETGKAGAEPA
jgi:tRNA A37 threonylcarbamoyladenosine dehydratase